MPVTNWCRCRTGDHRAAPNGPVTELYFKISLAPRGHDRTHRLEHTDWEAYWGSSDWEDGPGRLGALAMALSPSESHACIVPRPPAVPACRGHTVRPFYFYIG